MLFSDSENIPLLNDFKPEWLLSMDTLYIIVNNDEIKDVGEPRQWIVEEWEQLG